MPTTNELVEATATNQAAQQVEQINLAHEQIDKGTRGTAVCAITNGTTALNAAQSKSAMLKLTGSLSAPGIVTVPDRVGKSRPFYVWNATAQSITFKTVSGAGVVVAANTIAHLWRDTAGAMHAIGSGVNVGGSGERQTITVTTDEMEPCESVNAIAPIGESGEIYFIATDKPARVRVYSSEAARAADAEREVDVPGAAGIGLLAEVITASGALSVPMAPPADYFNADDPIQGVVYLSVTSYYDIEANVEVTLTFVANVAA